MVIVASFSSSKTTSIVYTMTSATSPLLSTVYPPICAYLERRRKVDQTRVIWRF
jgi:hypothetical protein